MTVQTVQTPAPTDLDLAGPVAGALATLEAVRAWSQALAVIGETVAPLVWTDIVPLHHWPLPKGYTLKTWANPRLKHPDESDEEFRRRAEAAAASASAVCMRSAELGVPMLVGLAQMWNIRGKLGMDTKLRYSLALARGVKVWDVELTPESVTVAGIHPATGEEVRLTVTMAQAKHAGWTENDNYRRNPVDMLWSRAMGRLLDRVAGHILSGIASLDSLLDERTIAGEVVEAPPPASSTRVTVEQLAAAADDAQAPAEPELPLDEPEVPMIEQSTWRAINAEWVRLGVKGSKADAERRLVGVRRIVDRDVAGGSQLTAVEGDLVLDTLRGLDPEQHADRIADILGERDTAEPPPVEDDPTTDPSFPAVEPQDGAR